MRATVSVRGACAVDDADAARDHERARGWDEVGWMPPGGRDERMRYRVASYRAERAFAIYRGLAGWERARDGFGAPDVDGYSVRYGTRGWYGLVVHRRDCGAPYALVTGTDDEYEFDVRGWLGHEEAVALRDRGVGFALPGTTGAWCLPQRVLREFAVVVP